MCQFYVFLTAQLYFNKQVNAMNNQRVYLYHINVGMSAPKGGQLHIQGSL